MIALNTDLEIQPISPLIVTRGVKKMQNLDFKALWFRNEATCRLSFANLNKLNDGPLTSQNLVKIVRSTHL